MASVDPGVTGTVAWTLPPLPGVQLSVSKAKPPPAPVAEIRIPVTLLGTVKLVLPGVVKLVEVAAAAEPGRRAATKSAASAPSLTEVMRGRASCNNESS
jgi:hypothetical protein